MRPWCVGDGSRATRWTGPGPDDFTEIQCPNELCQYRQTEPKQCKPFARLLFRLRWAEETERLPTPLAKFTTGSWNTVANLTGFFDWIEQSARNLGLREPKFYGLPFVMSLAYQTKASAKTRFPVVTITPEVDPVAVFTAQMERVQALAGYEPVRIGDPEMQSPRELAADVRQISRGIDLSGVVADEPDPAEEFCDGSGWVPVPGSPGEANPCGGCARCRS